MKNNHINFFLILFVLMALILGCQNPTQQPTNSNSTSQTRQNSQPTTNSKPELQPESTNRLTTREEWLKVHGCGDPEKKYYKNGDFKVTWIEDKTTYVGQLLLRADRGQMRIRLNEDNYIDQKFELKKCSSGYIFVGFDPVDAATGKPVDPRFNENFKVSFMPNGDEKYQRCSDTDECVDANIEPWKDE